MKSMIKNIKISLLTTSVFIIVFSILAAALIHVQSHEVENMVYHFEQVEEKQPSVVNFKIVDLRDNLYLSQLQQIGEVIRSSFTEAGLDSVITESFYSPIHCVLNDIIASTNGYSREISFLGLNNLFSENGFILDDCLPGSTLPNKSTEYILYSSKNVTQYAIGDMLNISFQDTYSDEDTYYNWTQQNNIITAVMTPKTIQNNYFYQQVL